VRKRLATPHSSGIFIISESREDFKMSALTPVAVRVTGLREARGLTRTRLAQLSGVSLRTLEDWEAGRRVPRDVYQIHAVAAALGLSIEEYLGL
jgi:DNA-binding transcriptional regulator YiaG